MPSQSAIRDARQRMQHAQIDFLPHTIVLDNATLQVSGVLGPLRRPFDEQGGGRTLVQSFEFSVSKDALAAAPTADTTTFTREGKTFTVRAVQGHASHHTSWHIVASRTTRPGEE